MSKWIAWHGLASEPPVDERVKINVLFRNGEEQNLYTADYFGWQHYGGDGDIVSYKIVEDEEFQEVGQPIKSDGGSSNYYKLTITNKAGESIQCETGDVIRCMVGNDFTLGNIIKACRRMYQSSLGKGKDGVSIEYDSKKIQYFSDDFSRWNE